MPTPGRHHRYTVDQIEAAIPDAIRAREITTALSLINMLAVRAPDRARVMLNGIHAALDVAKAAGR